MEFQCRNKIKALNTKKLQVFLELCSEMQELDGIRKVSNTKGCKTEDWMTEETKFLADTAILFCGYPALSGSIFLTEYFREELEKQFPAHFLNSVMELKTMEEEFRKKISRLMERKLDGVLYPLGEGGFYKTIYELGKDSSLGYHIRYQAVPIRQECVEICEFYDLDPWSVLSASCLLIVTEKPMEILAAMQEEGLVCARIGYMTRDKDKVICYPEMSSRINRPDKDGVLKILQAKFGEIAEQQK